MFAAVASYLQAATASCPNIEQAINSCYKLSTIAISSPLLQSALTQQPAADVSNLSGMKGLKKPFKHNDSFLQVTIAFSKYNLLHVPPDLSLLAYSSTLFGQVILKACVSITVLCLGACNMLHLVKHWCLYNIFFQDSSVTLTATSKSVFHISHLWSSLTCFQR